MTGCRYGYVFWSVLLLGGSWLNLDVLDLGRPSADAPRRWLVVLEDTPATAQVLAAPGDRAETERTLQRETRRAVRHLFYSGRLGALSRMKALKRYWIIHGFAFDGSPAMAAELARDPAVKGVFENRTERLIDLLPDRTAAAPLADDGGGFTYGLKMIRRPELTAAYPDLDGRGVTVGQIDTGIHPTHVEFAGVDITFRDFAGAREAAYDDNGHGTHISGTILGRGVGDMKIGVAPGVRKLIVGKAFDRWGSGSTEGIVRALEWMADPDENPDTDDAPRVVSNSWGGGPSGEMYREAVRRWVSLGIFPCFAAGNSGPRERTVGTPGGYPEAFAVGATNKDDGIAGFSSRGPSTFDGQAHVKPDVSAPGVNVISAYIPSSGAPDPNRVYRPASGTSMATPHVAGAIALLLQLKPKASVAEMRALLEASADRISGQTGKDNTFGAGRLNVLELARRAGAR